MHLSCNICYTVFVIMFLNDVLFVIPVSPSVKTTLNGLPILFMHSMKRKANSLSLFDLNGTITQYFVKASRHNIAIS